MKLKKLVKQLIPSTVMFQWFGISNPFSPAFTTLTGTVAKAHLVLNTLTGFSAFVAAAMLVYGGYTFIMSAGDDGKAQEAQSMMTNAVIGLVIVFLARLIIGFVLDFVL